MSDIKILDCTLREGGYANNWEFGFENIKAIINNLNNAGIDFIECGYLKNIRYSPNRTIFDNLCTLKQFITDKKFALMINFGEYEIDKLPQENNNIILRIAFKKHQLKEALNYCKDIKNKGYDIFINPMHTNTYDKDELFYLFSKVNEIKPFALTITDSTGSMKENDIIRLTKQINENSDKSINICFHSHNNLELSFSNSQIFIKNCKDRNIILDATLSGIGRGAGNLCTEIITQYLNENFEKKYDNKIILNLINKYISPIPKTWGYSIPYYLSGIHNCHPDFAKYLINRDLPYDKINEILQKIPSDKKTSYDENLIKQIL